MNTNSRDFNIAGWLVFAITAVVFYFSIESTGSLWDCGEFILGADKLQVVHPPGAPLFVLVGRIFVLIGKMFSDAPEAVAMSVNMMSGLSTAFAAMFIAWTTMRLGTIAVFGREGEIDEAYRIPIMASGLVAGLSTAFATSIWFSAVEGEVYAMSTMFTAMTIWAMIKWYHLPDNKESDRWFVFAIYSAGLSIGVHLLSILAFPALTVLYYFKKYKKHTFLGMAISSFVGVLMIVFIQKFVIAGIPKMWQILDIIMVNSFGIPFDYSLIPLALILIAGLYFGLMWANKHGNQLAQNLFVALALIVISFSTMGVVVIRARADTPVNMNDPDAPTSLLPYLNREQYGERPLLYGPTYQSEMKDTKSTDRYGRVGDHYEYVDQKVDYIYDSKDKMLFPRMQHSDQGRPKEYQYWLGIKPKHKVNMVDNIRFFVKYQLRYMYWRYFMWNFSGRQNFTQGRRFDDPRTGNWITGIGFIDTWLVGTDQVHLTKTMKSNMSRNVYFMLPFIFGLFGFFFHHKMSRDEFWAILAVFVITGIGIIIYSNEPPNEPRERDYIHAGSFMTYTIWIGLGVLALFSWFKEKMSPNMAGILASVVVLSAPILMGFQNFDDNSRRNHYGSRDYATNFLNSCAEDAIIFTYGDNDTYPLWYAQEVEGVRTDVRVVNLSLIQVDWYINKLRNRVNKSAPIKLTLSEDAIRGKKRSFIPFAGKDKTMDARTSLAFANKENKQNLGSTTIYGFFPTNQMFIPVNKAEILNKGIVPLEDSAKIVKSIPLDFGKKSYLNKGEAALLDVIASNLWDRPIYFAVTVSPDQMFGLADYVQLEGMAYRIIPIKSKSRRELSFYGNGRVATDIAYDNYMNKFKWGNFNHEDTYVSNYYAPSVQGLKYTMFRTANELLAKGEKDKALDITDKIFEAFPNNNFPYDYRTITILRTYIEAGDFERGKKHFDILKDQIVDNLRYYTGGNDRQLNNPYVKQEIAQWQRAAQDMINMAKAVNNTEYQKELEEAFAPFLMQ